MFFVDDVLIAEDVAHAQFACCLGACHGACCVKGTAGAPLDAAERGALRRALPAVRARLRPEARAVIEEKGAWEETAPGQLSVTCTADGACVFATYDGPMAKCALQAAHAEGQTRFPKPISCHLYPLRAERHGRQKVLRYEEIGLCAPARREGQKSGTSLSEFLRAPLIRKYGAAWYEKFRAACAARHADL